MALVLADRVQETTTTAGTGALTLSGAVSGFQSFAIVGNTNTCYYTIVDGSAWEVGIGTYATAGPTLTRTTILSNSSGTTSPLTLSSAAKPVFLTYPSEKAVNLDTSGNVSPLGTVASGTWQGATVATAYGGTGVTTSTGANSNVLRDANGNISANNIFAGFTSTATAGTTTTLTVASTSYQRFTGTLAQTVKLPDATTLQAGFIFIIDCDSTVAISIVDAASGALDTIYSGGVANYVLLSNATVAGTWIAYGLVPSDVDWGTNTLRLSTTVVTGGTWNGGTITGAYGGTGLTTFSAANNAVYSTGATTLTAGTLPVLAGGTGSTTATGSGSVVLATSPTLVTPLLGTPTSGNFSTGTFTWPTFNQNTSGNAATATTATNLAGGSAGTIPYQSASGTTVQLGAGTSGYVLQANGAAAPSWVVASTAAGVNNGTLTMAVAGTGLSGSQTFTANQSTGATFTVTSNATNANTASTIVARDASGNFTAGTITAALSGNATTATSATTAGTITSQANSATITAATANTASTIVLRDASGNFSAGTITAALSGNASTATSATTAGTITSQANSATITAATANTASTIVLRDASGNFSAGTITATLSGNASTATSATTATTATTANALNTANNYQVNSLGVGTSSTVAGQIKATTGIVTPGTTGVSTGFNVVNGDITTYRAGGTTGVVYLSTSGSDYIYWNGSSYYLGSNIALSAANYNSYAPTLTGTGASGTWGINVTGSSTSCSGNAATATTATNLSGGTVAATTITATGNITAYYSDDRLKTRLGDIENAVAKIRTLDTFYYEANETAQALGYEATREVGISAQQVQAVMPETVAPAPIDAQYLTVRYERLIPLLIAAAKEQDDKIARLEALVAKLLES